jgi:hypothetical protein
MLSLFPGSGRVPPRDRSQEIAEEPRWAELPHGPRPKVSPYADQI